MYYVMIPKINYNQSYARYRRNIKKIENEVHGLGKIDRTYSKDKSY